MNIQTGNKGDTRIDRGNNDSWIVEGVDNNGVWVVAEPGVRYDSQDEAEQAAETIAEANGGTFIGASASRTGP